MVALTELVALGSTWIQDFIEGRELARPVYGSDEHEV